MCPPARGPIDAKAPPEFPLPLKLKSPTNDYSTCNFMRGPPIRREGTSPGHFFITRTPLFLIISLLLATSSAFSIGVILRIMLLSCTTGRYHRVSVVRQTCPTISNHDVHKFENHDHPATSRTKVFHNEIALNSRAIRLQHSSILNNIKQVTRESNNAAHDKDREEKEDDEKFCGDAITLASYERSAWKNETHESLTRDLHNYDRVLVGGHYASSLYSGATYHEALVNPAMITHPNPKRVAIIGGTEGATLREVLKHRSVEEVFVLEFDLELLKICTDYMPEWSDCTGIEERDANSCFDDSRVSFISEDSHQWMIDTKEKIDVIIMDAMNPDTLIEMIDSLFNQSQFADSLFNSLSEDGVLAAHFVESGRVNEPSPEWDSIMDKAIVALQNAGFHSMHTYDEAHRQFLVTFKSYTSRARWYKTSAEIAIEVHKRLRTKTKSEKPVFLLFDAPTMIGYQVPRKAHENTYCRKEDTPWECEEYVGIDPETSIIPLSHLTAQKSTLGEFAGRGLFAAQDLPKGSTFDISSSVKAFEVFPSTWYIIKGLYKWAGDSGNHSCVHDDISITYTFIDGYGYAAALMGKTHWTIDSSITTFCNHGCNGTYNYGDGDDGIHFTESDDLDQVSEFLFNKATNVYSPVFERHLRQLMAVEDYTLRDIMQGEEILCDYLSFFGSEDWKEDVADLRDQCAGDTMGEIAIAEYESMGQ